jgi:hypothetical protein
MENCLTNLNTLTEENSSYSKRKDFYIQIHMEDYHRVNRIYYFGGGIWEITSFEYKPNHGTDFEDVSSVTKEFPKFQITGGEQTFLFLRSLIKGRTPQISDSNSKVVVSLIMNDDRIEDHILREKPYFRKSEWSKEEVPDAKKKFAMENKKYKKKKRNIMKDLKNYLCVLSAIEYVC